MSLNRVNDKHRLKARKTRLTGGMDKKTFCAWIEAGPDNVTEINKAEVFECVECVANKAVFPYEKDFTEVCRCCWTSRRHPARAHRKNWASAAAKREARTTKNLHVVSSSLGQRSFVYSKYDILSLQ